MTSRLKLFLSNDSKEKLKHSDAMRDLEAELPAPFRQWDSFSQAQYLEAAYLLPGYILSSQGTGWQWRIPLKVDSHFLIIGLSTLRHPCLPSSR